VLIDANAEYCAIARERIAKELPAYTIKANSEDAWGNPNGDGGNVIRFEDVVRLDLPNVVVLRNDPLLWQAHAREAEFIRRIWRSGR
jgi:hypothetical protein